MLKIIWQNILWFALVFNVAAVIAAPLAGSHPWPAPSCTRSVRSSLFSTRCDSWSTTTPGTTGGPTGKPGLPRTGKGCSLPPCSSCSSPTRPAASTLSESTRSPSFNTSQDRSCCRTSRPSLSPSRPLWPPHARQPQRSSDVSKSDSERSLARSPSRPLTSGTSSTAADASRECPKNHRYSPVTKASPT